MILATELLRAENMKLEHKIPLGTLVEVSVDPRYNDKNGIRGFVVEHTRDCDGEPLYSISLSTLEEANRMKVYNLAIYQFMVSNGWSEQSLSVVNGATK